MVTSPRLRALVIAGLVLAATVLGLAIFQAHKPVPCAPVMVYGVRGTGDAPGPSGQALAIADLLRTEPGRVSVEANPYPAVQDGDASYRESVAKGEVATRAWLKSTAERCPDSSLVLAGFSQGAHVVHNVMAAMKYDGLHARTVAVLIADPIRDPEDASVRDIVVGGPAPGPGDYIKIGGSEPVSLKPAAGRVLSICHARDFVCNSAAPMNGGKARSFHQRGFADRRALALAKAWLEDRV